jgi:hypothetical protein
VESSHEKISPPPKTFLQDARDELYKSGDTCSIWRSIEVGRNRFSTLGTGVKFGASTRYLHVRTTCAMFQDNTLMLKLHQQGVITTRLGSEGVSLTRTWRKSL